MDKRNVAIFGNLTDKQLQALEELTAAWDVHFAWDKGGDFTYGKLWDVLAV